MCCLETAANNSRQRWQQNLSSLRVAQCPWDPPPQQQQQQPIVNPPTLPSNVTKTEASPVTQQSSIPHPAQNGANAGQPYIKQEIKYEPGVGNYPPVSTYGAPGMSQLAQQRATHLLQQKFGAQANASLQAAGLHQQPPHAPLPGGQRPPHMQMPGPAQPRPPIPQYQPQQQSSVSTAQTDGSGDDAGDQWSEHVTFTQATGEEDRVWVDGLLRAHLDESIARTDSGLMVPLSEQPHLRNKKRKVLRQYLAGLSIAEAPTATTATALGVSQFDGGDDDEDDDKEEVKVRVRADEDEDAINSDLDDDEEEDQVDQNEGEGPVGETILCTYDKVQRVKNKWKCTLKDGILTTGGKEYVFHKANGEFEW